MLRLHDPVQCCSVFRPGEWVHRPLSAVELGRVFDIPPLIGHRFVSVVLRALPWLQSPPLKVLHHVSKLVFRGGGVLDRSQFAEEAKFEEIEDAGVASLEVKDAGVATLRQLSNSSLDPAVSVTEDSVQKQELKPVKDETNSLDPVPPPQNTLNLSSAELEVWQQQFAKSVKSDDAVTPVHLWDTRVWRVGVQPSRVERFKARYQCCPLTVLRKFLLCRWRRNVYRSFLQFLVNEYRTQWWQDTLSPSALQADCRAG